MEKTKTLKSNSMVISSLKGSLIATCVSLVGILFFAFIVKLFGITDGFLKPVNQIIKAISIMIGTFITLKKDNEKGMFKGLIIGIIYTLLAFLVFSILNGSFNFDKSLLTDVIFAGVTGAICGVITINIKKKNK